MTVSYYFVTLSRVLAVREVLRFSRIAGIMKLFSFASTTAGLTILCLVALISPVRKFQFKFSSYKAKSKIHVSPDLHPL